MDIVKFIDSHNEIIGNMFVGKDSVYERNIFPKGTVGFTYYHNENENGITYIVGVPLENLDVIKKANEKMYKWFLKFNETYQEMKYLIVVNNNQISFICTPSNTILVSNFGELKDCLYQLLYEKSVQVKSKK